MSENAIETNWLSLQAAETALDLTSKGIRNAIKRHRIGPESVRRDGNRAIVAIEVIGAAASLKAHSDPARVRVAADPTYIEARARRELAAAQYAEMRLKQKAGGLVDKAEAGRLFEGLVRELLGRFEYSIPVALAMGHEEARRYRAALDEVRADFAKRLQEEVPGAGGANA
jgi:hypothetical protein